MNRVSSLVFPLVMVAGLLISTLVIVNSLQAAKMPQVSPEIASVTAKSGSPTLVAQGRDLFVAKGCLVCHRNDNVITSYAREFEFGDVPNLTTLRINEEYLRQWLHDPQAIKPATEMPNLDLTESEIDALVAFLTLTKQNEQ